MVETAMWVREHLKAEGQKVSVVNMRFVKPIDEEVLQKIKERHSKVVTLEEGVFNGGFGEAVSAWYEGTPMRVLNIFCVMLSGSSPYFFFNSVTLPCSIN